MPKAFDDCEKAGGKIRTINVGKSHYAHVCVRPSGKGPRDGKVIMGEIKQKKSK